MYLTTMDITSKIDRIDRWTHTERQTDRHKDRQSDRQPITKVDKADQSA